MSEKEVEDIMNVNPNNHVYSQIGNFSKVKRTSAGMKTTFSNAMTTVSGNARTDSYAGGVSSAAAGLQLEDADYKYLSSNWNPNHMSQDEYDRFLDFLQSKGVLTEEDKKYVDYGGERCASFEPETWYSPLDSPVDYHKDGNVLAYVRYQSSIIYDSGSAERKHETDLYKKIIMIMEEMVKRR